MEGNPTNNEATTHWDENGFLDIRETEDEPESSGVETDTDFIRSDQITEIGMNQVPFTPKSPADIRKMMDKVQNDNRDDNIIQINEKLG